MRSIALPVLLVICFAACKKEKSPDDYIVEVGNQAFVVYLNGQPWVADYRDAENGVEPIDIPMFDDYVLGFSPHYNYVWTSAKKNNEQITLYIPPPLVPGKVLLNNTTSSKPYTARPQAYGMYEIYYPSKRFMTTAVVTGYIDIIRCDTVQRSIEARFEFEAVTATGEKVKVANGYFKKG